MSTGIIKSAAKFLQTPAKPERPLEEKIRFLIKEKKLTQYQLIAALKQANLYNIETIEPILTMCYYEQNTLKKNSKKIAPPKSKPSQPPYNQPPNQQQQPVSSWSPWWSTIATVGMGVTSFIASYTVSTTVSQNLLKKSEEKVSSQLEAVKTEIKEQADLDRERQHRDLMEVVNLLKTQVSCVQQNLGVLKQSIEVIQTQMKYNINDPHNTSIMLQNKNIRGSTGDDGSVISSGMSNSNNENKPNLNVIGNLLSQNDDGLDWLNSNIVTSNDNDDEKKMELNEDKKEIINEKKDDKSDIDNESVLDNDIDIESVDENDIIYHKDYKDMILTLPTDIIEIKQQLINLLKLWQYMVVKNEDELNVDKIKSGLNALNFYINKILKKPFILGTRKINTYNKQYKERLSTLPKIDTLLTLIGYEKDNVFWTLPLLYDENGDNNDEKCKGYHDKQMNFLTAFKEVFKHLFNIDESLPFTLSERLMKIKQERQEKENKDKKNENENENVNEKDMKNDNMNVISDVIAGGNDNNNNNNNNNVSDVSNAPETQYSNKFMEIAKLVQQGKKPDDVKVIDDMPPDPNAPPTESKMEPQKKPFQMGVDDNSNNNNNNKEVVNENLNWFEQYENQSNDVEPKSTDDGNSNEDNNKENANVENDVVQNDNK